MRVRTAVVLGAGLGTGAAYWLTGFLTKYVELTAAPKRKALGVISTPRRPTPKEMELLITAEDRRIKEMTRKFWLPQHLSGLDEDIWPQPLRSFAYNLSDRPTVAHRYKPAEVVSSLRATYPKDRVLMEFADFIEAAQAAIPEVTFKDEVKYVFIPRNNDGSFSLSLLSKPSLPKLSWSNTHGQ